MTNQLKGKIKNWINFQREVLSLYRNRIITRGEYFTYLHLRLNCNPYGIATTNIGGLNSDVFGGNKVSNNYINKILLSLRSKKLIWFKNRQGSRSSFEVHFGDFILPTGQIKTLDRYFEPNQVRGDDRSLAIDKSEVRPEVDESSQKLNSVKSELAKSFSWSKQNVQVTGRNTENDNQTKNKTYDNSELETFNNIGNRNLLIERFSPNSHEEDLAWKIAKEIGENDMRFIISRLNKYGLQIIEKAWIDTREGCEKGFVKNKGAYFNARVEKLAKDNTTPTP